MSKGSTNIPHASPSPGNPVHPSHRSGTYSLGVSPLPYLLKAFRSHERGREGGRLKGSGMKDEKMEENLSYATIPKTGKKFDGSWVSLPPLPRHRREWR